MVPRSDGRAMPGSTVTIARHQDSGNQAAHHHDGHRRADKHRGLRVWPGPVLTAGPGRTYQAAAAVHDIGRIRGLRAQLAVSVRPAVEVQLAVNGQSAVRVWPAVQAQLAGRVWPAVGPSSEPLLARACSLVTTLTATLVAALAASACPAERHHSRRENRHRKHSEQSKFGGKSVSSSLGGNRRRHVHVKHHAAPFAAQAGAAWPLARGSGTSQLMCPRS